MSLRRRQSIDILRGTGATSARGERRVAPGVAACAAVQRPCVDPRAGAALLARRRQLQGGAVRCRGRAVRGGRRERDDPPGRVRE